jgi:hypothetical protein
MATQQQPTDDETIALTTSGSFVDEIVQAAGGFDRPTLIFWSTQIVAWLIVVAVAMLWGIGGL